MDGNAVALIISVLRNVIHSAGVKERAQFVRIVKSCYYGLTNTVKTSRLASPQHDDTNLEIDPGTSDFDAGAIRTSLQSCRGCEVIVASLEKALVLKFDDSMMMQHGCALVYAIMSVCPSSAVVFVEAGWLSTGVSILTRDFGAESGRIVGSVLKTILLVASEKPDCALSLLKAGAFKVLLDKMDRAVDRCGYLLNDVLFDLLTRVLEILACFPETLSGRLLFRSFRTLRNVLRGFAFSSSPRLARAFKRTQSVVELLATDDVVRRLASRLQIALTAVEAAVKVQHVEHVGQGYRFDEEFIALGAILTCSRPKELLKGVGFHRIFVRLAALDGNFRDDIDHFGVDASLLRELICLSSQLLNSSYRESIFAKTLRYYSNGGGLDSLIWMHPSCDHSPSESEQLFGFLVDGIVSRYEERQYRPLVILLEGLAHLVKTTMNERIVHQSPHTRSLREILYSLLQESTSESAEAGLRCDVGVAALDAMATLVTELPGWLPVNSGGNDLHVLVSCCLKLLSNAVSCDCRSTRVWENDDDPVRRGAATFGKLIRSSGVILKMCVEMGAEYARSVIQHPSTKLLLENYSESAKSVHSESVLLWFSSLLSSMVSCHGLLFAEKLLALPSRPTELLLRVVDMAIGEHSCLSWRSFADCIAITSESSSASGGQIDDFNQIGDLREQAEHIVQSARRVFDMHIVETHIMHVLTCLSVIHVRWSSERPSHPASSLLEEINRSAVAHYNLFSVATGFLLYESKVAALHCSLARIAVQQGMREHQEFVLEVSEMQLLRNPERMGDAGLGRYIELASVVYLSSYSTHTLEFLDSSSGILKRAICRIAAGDPDAPQLEACINDMLSSLCTILNDNWLDIGVSRVLRLYSVFHTTSWSRNLMLKALFSLYQGVSYLLEIASASPNESVQEEIILFLHQNISELRHKTQRIGDEELKVVLSIISRGTDAVNDGSQSTAMLRQLASRKPEKILCAALEVLKDLVRVKRCAIVCCRLKGIERLYEVMGRSSHHETSVQTGLEICCYLTSHEENLQGAALLPLVKLLFLLVDARNGLAHARLAFLILDRCISLQSPVFTPSLVQQCHTQVLLWKYRGAAEVIQEEASETIRKLYGIRAAFAGTPVRSLVDAPESKKATGFFDKPSQTIEVELKRSILAFSSVVKCDAGTLRGKDASPYVYVDMKTSAKTLEEPLSYKTLCESVCQLKFLLHDTKFATDEEYISPLLLPLCGIVLSHTVTSDLICNVMAILAQITFLKPATVVTDPNIDLRGFFTSCLLHQRHSLPFAISAASVCDNVTGHNQGIATAEAVPLLELVFALLKTWTEDLDVVQSCTSALRVLLRRVDGTLVIGVGEDPLALLNGVYQRHAHDVSIAWNYIVCVLQLMPLIDALVPQSLEHTLTSLVGAVRVNVSNAPVAECALEGIECIYRFEKLLARRQLFELDAVQLVIKCLLIHSTNDAVVGSCMRVLLGVLSSSEDFDNALAQVVTNKGHIVIPMVCRSKVNDESICILGIQMLMRMIDVQDSSVERVGQIDGDKDESESEIVSWRTQVLQELLHADTLSLLFHLLDNCQTGSNASFIGMLLELLYDLTRLDLGRDCAEELHGLQHLQQVVNVVWFQEGNLLLLESAIDCLVNLACANRQLHGWNDISLWLLGVAESIQRKHTLPHCLEKLIGILTRLAVTTEMSHQLTFYGAHMVLQLLAFADDDRFLEQGIYTLMSQLCHDQSNVPVFIMFDAISITTERISVHLEDEGYLYACLHFLEVLASGKGCTFALQDSEVVVALQAIAGKYELTGKQVYRLSRSLLEKLGGDTPNEQAPRHLLKSISSSAAVNEASPSPGKQIAQLSQLELSYRDLLLEGAVFRMRFHPTQKQTSKVRIAAAVSGSYLLFHHLSSHPPRVERVFLSQLEILPNPDDGERKPAKAKRSFIPHRTRSASQAVLCTLHLMVRGESMSAEASSVEERKVWEQALQWLVLHQADGTFLTN